MKKLLLISFIILTKTLYSQQVKVTRDFGIWVGAVFEKRIFSDLDLNLEQQIRTFNNTSTVDDYLSDLGLKYSINKRFGLGANIRYIYDVKRGKETENNFRYNLDIEYKKEIKPKIKLRYRLRYQKEYINLFSAYFYNPPQKIYSASVRNKVKIMLKYNRMHSVYTSAELFRLIEIFKEPYFNKVRFYIGDEINTKIGEFDFSIGFEREIRTDYPYSFVFVKTIYTIKR